MGRINRLKPGGGSTIVAAAEVGLIIMKTMAAVGSTIVAAAEVGSIIMTTMAAVGSTIWAAGSIVTPAARIGSTEITEALGHKFF